MVRIPSSWRRLGVGAIPAGSYSAPGSYRTRRLTPVPNSLYVNQVTVDLGNDGMAPVTTFGAGGTAQALIGPSSSGEFWSLDQCFLSTSVGQLDPSLCTVFVGPLPLANFAAMGSLAGGSSQFGMGGLGCPFGWFVWAEWTGGTAGATTSFRVTGTKTTYTN